MSPPGAVSPLNRSDLAANQEPGIPLLAERYAVLDCTGRKLFTVRRDRAIEGIAQGVFVGIGRTCVKYLRTNSAADPARSERLSAPRTWNGPSNPGVGAPARFDHNAHVCDTWGPDPTRMNGSKTEGRD